MNLSGLLRGVWGDLGMTETFTATGGSATTVVNSQWQLRETQPDDNYAIDYTVIVERDAGGAGASPEGKFSRVTAYNSTTWTYTFDTMTDAVAAGDEIVLCTNEIPLREMVRLANRAFKAFGLVPAVPDKSLTSAANQTEYALPNAVKRGHILSVEYQGVTTDANDNQWIPVNWKVEPATYGSTGLIYLPQLPAGKTIKIVYNGVHADLTAYNSEIAETIPDDLAILALTKYALRWYINRDATEDGFWLQRYNEANQDFEAALVKWRSLVDRPKKAGRWYTVGVHVDNDDFTYPQTE